MSTSEPFNYRQAVINGTIQQATGINLNQAGNEGIKRVFDMLVFEHPNSIPLFLNLKEGDFEILMDCVIAILEWPTPMKVMMFYYWAMGQLGMQGGEEGLRVQTMFQAFVEMNKGNATTIIEREVDRPKKNKMKLWGKND